MPLSQATASNHSILFTFTLLTSECRVVEDCETSAKILRIFAIGKNCGARETTVASEGSETTFVCRRGLRNKQRNNVRCWASDLNNATGGPKQ
jgi:hypothetical protein